MCRFVILSVWRILVMRHRALSKGGNMAYPCCKRVFHGACAKLPRDKWKKLRYGLAKPHPFLQPGGREEQNCWEVDPKWAEPAVL